MKNICLTFFLLLAFIPTQAQDEFAALEQEIDSLEQVLEQLPKDSSRFDVLSNMAYASIYGGDIDGYVKYTKDYLSLAKALDDKFHLGKVYSRMIPNFKFADVNVFDEYMAEGEAYLIEAKDTINFINLLTNKAAYARTNLIDYELAIQHLQEALALCEQIDCQEEKVEINMHFAGVLMAMDECQNAIPYINEALNDPNVSNISAGRLLEMKGICYYNSRNLDSVSIILHQAFDIFQSENDTYSLQSVSSALGAYYLEKKNIVKAKKYFQIIEDIAEESAEESIYVYDSFFALADYYKMEGVLDSAIFFYERSIVDSTFTQDGLEDINNQHIYSSLSTIYEELGNYELAFVYLKKYNVLHNRALANDAKIAAEEFNVQYETAEKEDEIDQLNSSNQLLSAKNRNYLLGMLGFGLFGLFSFLVYLNIRKKNQVISEQKARLEQLNITKDRIFAIIGHDMRKPALAFRGIGKKVNYLLQKQDYKTLNALGNAIEKDALALNKLTDNLLNWALTQKNVMPYNPQRFAVADIVEETLSVFQAVARDKNIQLQSKIPTDLYVFADRNALLTIIRNLVDNAIKYTPENGQINIIANADNDKISLQVEDTGVGIPQSELSTIFLLKEDKSKVGTAGEQGTGLGLHLVHELVKLNKGAIEVASTLGQGTRFNLELPTA